MRSKSRHLSPRKLESLPCRSLAGLNLPDSTTNMLLVRHQETLDQYRLQELESGSADSIDADASLERGLEKLRGLPHRIEASTLAERTELVHDLPYG